MECDELVLENNSHGWEPIFCSSLREAYYDVIARVPNKQWKEFARTGLGIDETVIDNICHDIPNNVREQQFQMCRKWGETECIEDGVMDEDHLEILNATVKYLYKILNHFLLGEKYPKPDRKKMSKRRRYMRNYCYRVNKVVISSSGKDKRLLSRYATGSGCKEVVIFNNTFTHSTKFVPRKVTGIDVENMRNLWQELGCNVTVHTDITAIDMTRKLKDYAAKWCHLDYCVIIIMSHGDKGDVIYGESYQAENFVYASDIVDIFSTTNSEQLSGVPKLFFFECSRGGKVGGTDLASTNTKPSVSVRPFPIYENQMSDMPSVTMRKGLKKRSRSFTVETGSEEKSGLYFEDYEPTDLKYLNPVDECQSPVNNIPPLSDMLICFSTAPGFSSFRDPRNGSWFINAVTNVFMTHANQQHIVLLMMKVGEAMSERTASEKSVEGQKCISHFECTLSKELYLANTLTLATDHYFANQRSSEKQQGPAKRENSTQTNPTASEIEPNEVENIAETTRNENSRTIYQSLIFIIAGFLLLLLYQICDGQAIFIGNWFA